MKCVKVSMGMCTHVPVGHYHLIEYKQLTYFIGCLTLVINLCINIYTVECYVTSVLNISQGT